MRRFALLLFLALISAAFGVLSAQSVAPPPAPTGVEASDGAYSTKVGLSWNHVQGAALYHVFRSIGEDPASAIAVGSTASVIFYDSGAAPGQAYFYWVQAEGAGGASLFSTPDQGFRGDGLTSGFGAIAPLAPPPVPAENPVTGAKVYLGKTLFWDEQISSTGTVACGACHFPSHGGSDPRSVIGSRRSLHPGRDGEFDTEDDVTGSPGVPRNRADGTYLWSDMFGIREQVTRRKAQSVTDAAYSDAGLFWDGRALTEFRDPLTGEVLIAKGGELESQALHPFLDSTEMSHVDTSWSDVLGRIRRSQPLALSPSIPAALRVWIAGRGYADLFSEAFGTPEITPARVAMAIASYERTLYSDRTRLDAVVAGLAQFTPAEARGRELFFESNCGECHRGNLLSDNRFRFIGVRPMNDEGRAEVTRNPTDGGRFRTPTLRNAILRGPFMHDGSIPTMAEVVEFYDRGGDFDGFTKDTNFVRRLRLTPQEKSDLTAFLGSLMVDPRAETEAAPLFDRPMLYSESARVPQIVANGAAPPGVAIPQVIAIEPPFLGNSRFTVGVYDARAGAQAVLVIDANDPGAGPAVPARGSLFRGTVTTAEGSGGQGFASINVRIPDDPALEGATFFGRWYVPAPTGLTVTPAFRMTVFGPPETTPDAPSITSVSAASLRLGFVAPESIVSGFGSGLAGSTAIAQSLPLPATLAGVRVLVTDRNGVERAAPLFYVSPRQINYQIPPGAALGEATVTVLSGTQVAAIGKLQVASVAPSIFAANSDGRGPAAAQAFRGLPDGSQAQLPVVEFDAAQNRFVASPVALGPQNGPVVLVLYGTGIRNAAEGAVSVTVGGMAVEVLYAGPQGEFAGLDQINVRLPAALEGKGEVDVVVQAGSQGSNRVQVHVR